MYDDGRREAGGVPDVDGARSAASRCASERAAADGAREIGGARGETNRAASERRAAPRYDARTLAESMACRVNPGHDVQLVNLSAAGACVEAAFALLPGRPLQLHVQCRGRRAALEARVAWCVVTTVIPGRGVRYVAGLAFMRWVDLVSELMAHPRPDAPDGPHT